MPLEEKMTDGRYEVRAELPDVDPDKDVEITACDGQLTIRAERSETRTPTGDRSSATARSSAPFCCRPGPMRTTSARCTTKASLPFRCRLRSPRRRRNAFMSRLDGCHHAFARQAVDGRGVHRRASPRTRAKAQMRWRDQEMTAIGIARLNLSDSNVTNVGDELAMNWPSHERCRTWRICSPRRHQTSTRPRTSRS